MRTSARLRRRARRGFGLVPALAFAVATHAFLLIVVAAPFTRGAGGMIDPGKEAPEEAASVAPLEPTCVGDAIIGAGAEATWSETPFGAEQSFSMVVDGFDQDLRRCRNVDQSPVAVAILDPAQLQRLKSIDPEPLLDTITPEAERLFEQQQQQAQQKLEQEVQQMAQRPPKEAQVVETAKPQVEVAPDQAHFVSEYNTKAERETVARGSRREEMVQAPKPEELKVNPETKKDPSISKPTDRPEGADERAPDAPGKLSMRTRGSLAPSEVAQEQKTRGAMAGDRAPTGDGASPHHGDGSIAQEHRDPADLQHGQAGAGGGAPKVPNLRPSDDVLERVAGGGSVDHYDDVDEGDVTAVNSRQWVGASFMNRMKRQIAQEWRPADVWRRYDPTGSVYGFKTRVTVLRITLAPDGTMTKALVVRGSGVDYLDDEAIRAVKAAAPFPNPPAVLRGDDGNITFPFGFYFEIDGGHESWKIFRAQ